MRQLFQRTPDGRKAIPEISVALLAAVAVLSHIPSGSAFAASPQRTETKSPPEVGKLKVKFNPERQRLYLFWKGRMAKPMAREFRLAIAEWKFRAARGGVRVILDSHGGKVRQARLVVDMLTDLKKTHRVDTYVGNGRTCGSSCVAIFLAGQHRVAGPASSWLFHQISRTKIGEDGRKVLYLRPIKTKQFFQKYFRPAGIPQIWIDDIHTKIKGRDYWMTGRELMASNGNLITRLTSNQRIRKGARIWPPQPPPRR